MSCKEVRPNRVATRCITMQPNATKNTPVPPGGGAAADAPTGGMATRVDRVCLNRRSAAPDDFEANRLAGDFGDAGAEEDDEYDLEAPPENETDASFETTPARRIQRPPNMGGRIVGRRQQTLSSGSIRLYAADEVVPAVDCPSGPHSSREINMRLFETEIGGLSRVISNRRWH